MYLITKLLVLSFWIASAPWLTNFEKAKSEATDSRKTILISFSGSDWCGPCIRMKKEIFEAPAFEAYATENLVLLKADFPRLKKNQLPKEQIAENEKLAERYNPEGKFPFTVLTDANGKVLKQWEGYPGQSTDGFIGEVKNALQAISK